MENYEQKYKHALSLAKQVYDSTISEQQKENISIIFPELKESEDEKIREELIHFLVGKRIISNDLEGIDIDKTLSWLEKQKNIVEEYEDKLDRCACESWDKGYKACLEKQKKEWSEEDGILLHNVLKDLEQLEKSANIEQLKDVYQKEIDWLNSLKPRWKPSEEQLRAIMDSAQGLYQCKEKEVLLDLYEQLKNL